MCFHYFIFATGKKSHKLQHTHMQVFYFWDYARFLYNPCINIIVHDTAIVERKQKSEQY